MYLGWIYLLSKVVPLLRSCCSLFSLISLMILTCSVNNPLLSPANPALFDLLSLSFLSQFLHHYNAVQRNFLTQALRLSNPLEMPLGNVIFSCISTWVSIPTRCRWLWRYPKPSLSDYGCKPFSSLFHLSYSTSYLIGSMWTAIWLLRIYYAAISLPATLKSCQGEPPVTISTSGISLPFSSLISPYAFIKFPLNC